MTARVYLRLFRPLHAVLVTAFYAFGISRFSMVFFHGTARQANWIGLAGLAPLIWGGCLANAANTAIYRPSFPLLPRGRERLLRSSIVAIAISVVIFTAALVWCYDMPVAGAAGLVAACVTVQFWMPRTDVWILGIILPIAALLAWAPLLQRLATQLPWVVLPLGLVACGLAVRRAFSPSQQLARAFTPYNPLLGSLFAFRDRTAVRRYGQEYWRWRMQVRQRKESPETANAPIPRFNEGTWGDVRAFWYAAGHKGGFLRMQCLLAIALAAELAALPIFVIPVSTATTADYARVLGLGCAIIDPMAGQPHAVAFLAGMPPACLAVFFAALVMISPQPRTVIPLSRRRQAQVAFNAAVVQIVAASVVMSGAVVAVCAVAYRVGYHTWAGFGVTGFAATALAVVPLLPVFASLRTISRSEVRMVLAIGAGLGVLVIGLLRTRYGTHLVTPGGVAGAIVVAGLATWLLRVRLFAYYRTADLLHAVRIGASFSGAQGCGG